MFRLIRIENSGVNVPEPIKITKEVGVAVKMGDALIASSGIVEPCGVSTAPTYIALSDAKPEDKFVYCYRVHPHMLFEVELSKTPESIYIGHKIKLATDLDGSTSMVSGDIGGPAEIIEILGRGVAGDKVTVKF